MKNWKAILGVSGIFLLGMVAGGLVVVGVVAPRAERVLRGEPLFTAAEITRRVEHKLDLDAGQRAQVLTIVADVQQQLRDLRRQSAPQSRAVIDAAVAKVRALLRPEQQAKLDQLVAGYAARWRR